MSGASASTGAPRSPRRGARPLTAVLLGSLGAIALASASGLASCKDDPHLRSDGASPVGGACQVEPGQLPEPNCDNSSKECTPQPGCTIDEGRCGSASTCLPLADQKGKKIKDLRIRRLNIAAPAALAQEFIQRTVVTLNIDLAEKSCGEVGKGLFSWIFRVDRDANELLTGGAPPPTDALGQGFCFANYDANGIAIEPARFKIAFEGDTFRTTEKQKLNVPVFLSADLASSIVLPLSDVTVSGVTLSDDGNCVGSFRKEGLQSDCAEDPTSCPKWLTAGALGGYMTLEEADAVIIRDLGRSLCVVLSQGTPNGEGKCLRGADGKLTYKGDYCSTTKKAGDCQDSVWLAATFAASGAKIFDGAGVPGCSGASTRDGGADASKPDASLPDASADASPPDASADASQDARRD